MMRHIILIKNLHHHQFCHLTCGSQPLNISQAHRQQHWGGGVGVGEARLGEHHQHHDRQGILVGEARLGVNHSMLAGSQYFIHSRSQIIPAAGNCIDVNIINIMIDIKAL